jgi:hypothetical protein
MRYQELLEADVYRDSSHLELPDIIRVHYADVVRYIQNDSYIYRGMQATSEMIVGNSESMKRQSTFGANYIMTLSSYLPSWEGWPRRDRSFICSTSDQYAEEFGTVYIVVPLGVQTFAVCYTNDFNFSRVNSYRFNDMMYTMLSLVDSDLKTSGKYKTDPKALIEILDEFIVKIKESNYELLDRDLKLAYYDDSIMEMVKMGPERWLDKRLDPENFAELIHGIDKLIFASHEEREVWFEGKALFVAKDKWDFIKYHILEGINID